MPVGGDGSWDYLRVDPDAHRLYISRGSHMMVVDEVSGKVVGDIPDRRRVSMVLPWPRNSGKGFTSNGTANSVTIVDLKTLKPMSEIKIMGGESDSDHLRSHDQARLHL